MMPAEEKVVSVFGANDAAEGSEAYQTARAAGCVLAKSGFVVANGGYGGTMEASARGATECGGQAIGVTCTLWNSRPNRFITRVVETHDLSERVNKLIELGTGGYVVLPGATGTLVELAMVWERMCKGLLQRRPLVCVGRFWGPLIEMMTSQRAASGEMAVCVTGPDELARCFSPSQAV